MRRIKNQATLPSDNRAILVDYRWYLLPQACCYVQPLAHPSYPPLSLGLSDTATPWSTVTPTGGSHSGYITSCWLPSLVSALWLPSGTLPRQPNIPNPRIRPQ